MGVSLHFAFRYRTCLTLGPALLYVIISMWFAFPETTLYSDFVRKGKKRNGEQGTTWCTPPPLSLSPSFTWLQLHWPPRCSLTRVGRFDHTALAQVVLSAQNALPPGVCVIHLLLPWKLSNATFWTRLNVTTLFNTVTSLHAHSHTPETFPLPLYFFYLSVGTYHLLPLCLT